MQALNGIGGFVSGKAGQGILTGVSALTNFLQQKKRQDYLNNQIAYQKMVQGIVSDPAKLSARARALESPLDTGLVQGVGNQVQAYAAERGLSTSPQIQQAILAQALGPYMQHNQDTALNAAMSSLGIPLAGTTSPDFGNPLDLSAMLKSLLKRPDVVTLDQPSGSVIPKPGITEDVPPDLDPSIFGPGQLPPDLFPENNRVPAGGGGGGAGAGDGGMSLDDILAFAR